MRQPELSRRTSLTEQVGSSPSRTTYRLAWLELGRNRGDDENAWRSYPRVGQRRAGERLPEDRGYGIDVFVALDGHVSMLATSRPKPAAAVRRDSWQLVQCKWPRGRDGIKPNSLEGIIEIEHLYCL